MACVFCGGKLENRRVTFTHGQDGKYLVVENVEVCIECGEKTFSPQDTDELLKFGWMDKEAGNAPS